METQFTREELSIIDDALKDYLSKWEDHRERMEAEFVRRSESKKVEFAPFLQVEDENPVDEDENPLDDDDDLEVLRKIIRDNGHYLKSIEDLILKVIRAELTLK